MDYDYRRFAILYVDDEVKSLEYFRRAFGTTFRVFTAANAEEGFRLLQDHQDEIGVILSDQRMAGEKGVQLLARARRLRPQIVRILVTAYADMQATIDAVNSGAIYRYVTKPWDVAALTADLKRCLEFFMVQLERDLLLRERLTSLHRAVITDRILGLGVVAAGLGQVLRHPLDAVRKFTELAAGTVSRQELDSDRLQDQAYWAEFHRQVQSKLKQMIDLLNDLADQNCQPFRFDTEVRLARVIDEAKAGLDGELGQQRVAVINAVSPSLPPLWVDARHFRQLFAFVLRNALCTMPEGGTVRFEASLKQPDGANGPEIELTVTDDGPGLPPSEIAALFDPLVLGSERFQKCCVNLMACYFIVFHHAGRIDYEAQGERGNTLTMLFPTRVSLHAPREEEEEFVVRALTNERLWQRFQAGL